MVCPDPAGARAVLPAISKLWAGCATPVHLALPPQEGYGGPGDALREEARKSLAALEAAGCNVQVKEVADWSSGGPDPATAEGLRFGGRAPGAGGEKGPCPP